MLKLSIIVLHKFGFLNFINTTLHFHFQGVVGSGFIDMKLKLYKNVKENIHHVKSYDLEVFSV